MVKRILLCLFVVGFMVAFATTQTAFAAGTPVGTVISNQAYADYTDANDNAMPRAYSNTVTTTVSQVAALSLEPASGSTAGSNSDTVMYLVQIFNNGNGNDQYTYTYTTGGTWVPDSVTFYHDANNNHAYDAGTDPLIGTGAGPYTSAIVVPDDDYDILMFVTIPADLGTAPDATSSIINFQATSIFDPSKSAAGAFTTTVATAVIATQKTHTPLFPAKPIPRETVTYTLVLNNNGSTDATSVDISDVINSNMTYVAGSTTVDSVIKTDASDGDGVTYVSGSKTLNINLAILAVSGRATITFQARVNANVAANTEITNQANISYTSGTNVIDTSSNGDTFFVGSTSSVTFTPTTATGSGDPGTTMTYAVTITNNGNSSDIFNIEYTSGQAWTWAIWVDMNGDGIAGTNGDYLLTDTNADGKIDTGSMAQNTSITLLSVSTIMAGTSDGTLDTSIITATSVSDPTKTATLTLTTTVNAPTISLVKTVSPTGDQPPGTELTYTITVTNNGHGIAKSVVITDMIPAHTTYKAESMLTGSTLGTLLSRTDATDADNAQYDTGSNAVVVGSGVSTINLGFNGTYILRFTVTID